MQSHCAHCSVQQQQQLHYTVPAILPATSDRAPRWTGAGRAFSAGGNFTDASTTVPEEVPQSHGFC